MMPHDGGAGVSRDIVLSLCLRGGGRVLLAVEQVDGEWPPRVPGEYGQGPERGGQGVGPVGQQSQQAPTHYEPQRLAEGLRRESSLAVLVSVDLTHEIKHRDLAIDTHIRKRKRGRAHTTNQVSQKGIPSSS